jgi:hypothetical protein
MPNGHDDLPRPQFPLLARVNYRHTDETVVSLCAVQTPHGPSIRFYKWRKPRHLGEWRVALANASLKGVNLDKMAKDARAFSVRFGVPLEWTPETNPPAPEAPEGLTREQQFLLLLRECFGERIPSDAELRQKGDELERTADLLQSLADEIRAEAHEAQVREEDIPF